MAINEKRKALISKRANITDIFPNNKFHGNFAIFGHNDAFRCNVGAIAADAYIGKVGVILIHNEINFNRYLETITRNHSNVRFITVNPLLSNYDPLYGLNTEEVLDAIAPKDMYNSIENDKVRSYLDNYLTIINNQYRRNNGIFGSHPFNLNILTQLTAMNHQMLNSSVIDYMADRIEVRRISEELTADAIIATRSKVKSFATKAQEYFWSPGNGAEHSRISLISACQNKDVISIYVPNYSKEILDYLAIELRHLVRMGIGFLLLESGINLTVSGSFSSFFFNHNSHPTYNSGIISKTLTPVLGSEATSASDVISVCNNVLVLPLATAAEATPFSLSTEPYYYTYVTYNNGETRQPFRIFSGHNNARNEAKVELRSIRTDELTDSNCVLWTKTENYPILIENLIV